MDALYFCAHFDIIISYCFPLISLDIVQKQILVSILSISKPRNSTITLFLKIENEVLPVCKKMFLQTLDLKEWSVRNWISNSCNGSGIIISPDHQKNISKVGRKPNKNKGMTQFFDNLPKLPSHYCRSNTNKLYLESFFESKVSVFKAYVASLQGDETAVSKTEFYSEFQKRNLALYSPKKTCVIYVRVLSMEILHKMFMMFTKKKKNGC